MLHKTTKITFIAWLFICSTLQSIAQTSEEKEAAYTKVITGRADKIVQKLSISTSEEVSDVRDLIANQYRQLNTLYDTQKAKVKEYKSDSQLTKTAVDSLVKISEQQLQTEVEALHKHYLKSLKKKLAKDDVEKVKDGMTYGVLPITYKGYLEMLPDLTNKQKKQIRAYLSEAREHAMDAESSDKKHAWFGKYKGRINNYLSSEGIDMKKASKAWEERIKAAAEAAKKTKE